MDSVLHDHATPKGLVSRNLGGVNCKIIYFLYKIAKLYADNGNTLVELIVSKSHENKKDRDFFTIGASHLAFTVDDLQKTYEHLLKNGIKFNAPPQSPPDGKAKVTFCEDPDGTPIELVEVINSN